MSSAGERSQSASRAAHPPVRIGVVSDTHIPEKARALPARVLRGLEGCDRILHAGDLIEESVLEVLGRIAPVNAVAGNNDPPSIAGRLGWKKLIDAGPALVGLVHGHRGRGGNTPDRAASAFAREKRRPAVVVFGHSHVPLVAPHGAVLRPGAAPLPYLLFNPGSPTDRRHAPRCSYGILTISETGEVRAELVYL